MKVFAVTVFLALIATTYAGYISSGWSGGGGGSGWSGGGGGGWKSGGGGGGWSGGGGGGKIIKVITVSGGGGGWPSGGGGGWPSGGGGGWSGGGGGWPSGGGGGWKVGGGGWSGGGGGGWPSGGGGDVANVIPRFGRSDVDSRQGCKCHIVISNLMEAILKALKSDEDLGRSLKPDTGHIRTSRPD
ncbi:PREDICTED: glycine-rich cell wall structural protein 1.0-like [Dufourea novaeangliae]|uniref:glycine-rich cell wall structural protein 1.0-like n=1 Tax=Dufourea novaeangliae TaxID=178035 RepID=UPI0007673443|nr:PREDICTED: glycine-rich cell wall structural protein 1.0-like [Dufourea novaeangliae]